MNPYLLANLKLIYKPAPSNLLDKLSPRSKIICALEAAKIVIHLWENWANTTKKKLTKKQKESPKKTIETVEKWLIGKATINEIKKDEETTDNAIRNVNSDPYGQYGVYSDHEIFTAVDAARAANYTASAVVNYAVVDGDYVYRAVYIARTAYARNIRNAPNVDKDAVKDALWDNIWSARCYPLIEKEFQDKYDTLCKQINGDL